MTSSGLREAFLEDHRRLVRGLSAIVEAVEEGELDQAADLAAELDADAGAHMAFEEEVFYPRIAETQGQSFVDRLMEEHEIGQRAIKALLGRGSGNELTEEERRGLLANLNLALAHTLSCGTLISVIDGDPERDEEELGQLEDHRRRAELWSDRSYSGED